MVLRSSDVELRRRRWLDAANVFERRLRQLAIAIKAYNPDQPREPAGTPVGGRWARLAQNAPRGRGTGFVSVSGRLLEATPAQEARLIIAEAQAREAVQKVQNLDPRWRPTPSLQESVEGAITAAQAEAAEAQSRLRELALKGIGPGSFAGDSIPARGPGRDFTSAERKAINYIGWETGCHTCGTTLPGTRSGNFVCDHQPPNALNFSGGPQRLFPQCTSCSLEQAGAVRSILKGLE